MIIRSKAPFRVSFGGGGTDMPPYCTEHGGCVISTTIDRHVYVSIKPRRDKKIRVNSIDFNEEIMFDIGDTSYESGYEIFKGIVNVLEVKNGFDITAYSELPSGSGMGGSSALTVAIIAGFNKIYDLGLSVHDIAQKACDIERIELKQKGGYQDQYAAACGGLNFIEFTDEIKVYPIQTSSDMINELQYRLILCYVGGSHFSSDIQDEVLKGYNIQKKSFMEAMQELKDVACSMREIMKSKNLDKIDEFGKLLHKGWLVKKSLSSKISNKSIENFYLTSSKFGVLGGKLLGAGGGGHLLLFSHPHKKYDVMEELKKIGGTIVNFHFNPKGVEVWQANY